MTNTYTVYVALLIEANSEAFAYDLVSRTMRAIQEVEFEEHLLAWRIDGTDLEVENIDQLEDE